MTSLYQVVLPECFPHCLIDTRDAIRELVAKLMQRDDLANGSSFAVTVELSGHWILWLSEASYRYLSTRLDIEPRLLPATADEVQDDENDENDDQDSP